MNQASNVEPKPKLLLFVLVLTTFLSGVSALVFETLWFRQAGLLFGNSVWASSTVLAGFMAGIALGNAALGYFGARLKSPLLTYIVIELAIGVSGFALVLLFPKLNGLLIPLLQPILDEFYLLNGVRISLTFLILLIPTFAMGATLPVLLKALCQRGFDFGPQLSLVYGCNTLGAVIGALLSELLLIEVVGIVGAGLFAAILNVLAAFIVWQGYGRKEKKGPPLASPNGAAKALGSRSFKWFFVAFLAGFSLLALEQIWFRLTLLVTFGNSTAFAVMLAVVLAGIGFGGLISARWEAISKLQNPITLVALLSAILVIECFRHFPWEPSQSSFWPAVKLMFAVSTTSGVLFPLIGRQLFEELGSETKASGYLALSNTLGATLGAFVSGFVLLPNLGTENSLLLISVIYFFMAASSLQQRLWTMKIGQLGFLGLCLAGWVASVSLFPAGQLKSQLFKRFEERAEGAKVVAFKEGITQTITYLRHDRLQQPFFYQMFTNCHSMSGNGFNARQYMKFYVYLPVALHPKPKKALLICYGVGCTAKALTDTRSFEEIDIVDISPGVLELSQVPYPRPQDRPLNDKRVKVHIEDGRFYLQSTEKQYDLITGEPPPPKGGGVVNLYSREHFSLIHKRLAEGGMVTYWLPIYQLKVSDFEAIVKAFIEVFPESSLWMGGGSEWMLFGVKTPTKVSRELFSRQWKDPMVRDELVGLGFEKPAQLGSFFLADAAKLRELTGGKAPLTDNYPHRLSPTLAPENECPEHYSFLVKSSSAEDFAKSSHIQKLWPESLIREGKSYFKYRALIHDLWDNYKVLETRSPYGDLLDVLRTTDLAQLPLWLCGTNQDEMNIIQRVGLSSNNSEILSRRGAYALSKRDYLAASSLLSRAKKLDPSSVRIGALRAISLGLKNDSDAVPEALQGLPESVKREIRRGLRESPGEGD